MSPTEAVMSSRNHTVSVGIHRLAHAPEGLPEYATEQSAGMDVRAAIEEPLTLAPFARTLVPTGLIMVIPNGYECQIRPRSGLSIKHGITLVNCVGTIDADYRDEVKVPIINLGQEPYTIQPGERIAQLIIAPVTRCDWEMLDDINPYKNPSSRQGGFGSTGSH